MRVSVQWCNDTNSSQYGYAFRCQGKIIERCEESDYDEVVEDLESQGYIISR